LLRTFGGTATNGNYHTHVPFYAFDSRARAAAAVHIHQWLETRTYRGDPFCGCCGSRLHIAAAHSPATSAHFAHPRSSSCPLSSRYAIPFHRFAAIPRSPSHAASLRAGFDRHLEQVFNKCAFLADNLSFSEFLGCFEAFHTTRGWEYAGLTLEYLPYVLLCFQDLFPSRLPYRAEDFYFLVEPRINIGDLWIRPAMVAQQVLQVYPASGRVLRHPIVPDLAHFSMTAPTAFARTARTVRGRL